MIKITYSVRGVGNFFWVCSEDFSPNLRAEALTTQSSQDIFTLLNISKTLHSLGLFKFINQGFVEFI
jgi:hypothetical protein